MRNRMVQRTTARSVTPFYNSQPASKRFQVSVLTNACENVPNACSLRNLDSCLFKPFPPCHLPLLQTPDCSHQPRTTKRSPNSWCHAHLRPAKSVGALVSHIDGEVPHKLRVWARRLSCDLGDAILHTLPVEQLKISVWTVCSLFDLDCETLDVARCRGWSTAGALPSACFSILLLIYQCWVYHL